MLCNFVGWVVWAYLLYYFALFAVGRSPWSQWGLYLFPGSPRARTKNRKERGEPGRIYHVRNIIGRENLITCGRTNELTHASWLCTYQLYAHHITSWGKGGEKVGICPTLPVIYPTPGTHFMWQIPTNAPHRMWGHWWGLLKIISHNTKSIIIQQNSNSQINFGMKTIQIIKWRDIKEITSK